MFRFLDRFQTDLELLFDIFRFAFDSNRFQFECGATFNVLHWRRFPSFQLNRFLDIFHLIRRFRDFLWFLHSQTGGFFHSVDTRFPGCRLFDAEFFLYIFRFQFEGGGTCRLDESDGILDIFLDHLFLLFDSFLGDDDIFRCLGFFFLDNRFRFQSDAKLLIHRLFRQRCLDILFVDEDGRLGQFDDQVF